jgi:hypothetical protein
MSGDLKDIYRWLVHLLIYSDKDPAHKLMNFLLENGVNDNDLEYGKYSNVVQVIEGRMLISFQEVSSVC